MLRYDAKYGGSVRRGNDKYIPLFLDSDELIQGKDLWLTVWENNVVIESWKRNEDGSVESKHEMAKLEDAETAFTNFGNWLENNRTKENFDRDNDNDNGDPQ